jgi:hypothetical protein
MRKMILAAILLTIAATAFPQTSPDAASAGLQFSGTLSMNLIDALLSSTAYMDTVDGLSYLQLNPSLKDGPFGFDSALAVGPGNSVNLRYAYGYADLLSGKIHVAVGKFIDPDTFALNSFFVGGADGPGSFGNPSLVNANGNVGNGINGIQLKLSPVKYLVLGGVLPYSGSDTVNTSLKRTAWDVSYTVEKLAQFVVGYTLGHTGVADLGTPINNVDQNKLYLISNLLVSDSLVAGARYELDHDVSKWQVISHNAYVTLGDKLGDFSLGADAGLYLPRGGSAGWEVLGVTSYTVKSILPLVDFQPSVTVSYVSGSYQESPYQSLSFNPQLRFLLGKSQHELAIGLTATYNLDQPFQVGKPVLCQLNVLMQVYF